MNDSGIEPQSNLLTPQPDELVTPHFDDSAVASAHQVEPLPKRRAIRPGSSRLFTIVVTAIVIAIGFGITTVALWTRQASANEGIAVAPAVGAAASAEVTTIAKPEVKAGTTSPAIRSRNSAAVLTRTTPRMRTVQIRPRRTINSYMAEDFSDDENDSRPVARRVGVLNGRSRGQQ